MPRSLGDLLRPALLLVAAGLLAFALLTAHAPDPASSELATRWHDPAAAKATAERLLSAMLGLAGCLGTVAALLMRQSRRVQGLLGEAQAERCRAGAAERRLRAVIDAAPAMITAFDAAGRCLFVNREHAAFFGLEPVAACARPADEVGVPSERLRAAASAAGAEPAGFSEEQVVSSRGVPHTLLTRVVPVAAEAGGTGALVHVAVDITERRHAEERIRHLAHHDALTGLPNRALFLDRLRQSMAGAARHGHLLAVHCIDLDRFKEVNDTLGHLVGDALLIAAAERMASCLREYDLLARLGGDEFAIIQDRLKRHEDAGQVADRLLQVLTRPFSIEGHDIMISASIGSSFAAPDAADSLELLRRADLALYRSKTTGRGRHTCYDPEMSAHGQARKRLEQEMREALEGDGFRLVYQPRYRLADRRLVGCEALLRWTHPISGPIPPDWFIPIAEETGLILPLGSWVMREACRQIERWQRAGLEGTSVAVNLSAAQFGREDLIRGIDKVIAASGIRPELLEVEITESVLMQSTEEASGFIAAMRQRGIQVALDDFGTGYSSLAYLQRFAFDKLKIDRSFIRNLGRDRTSVPIVESVVQLAHTLGMHVVAEGVETEEQLEALRSVGCDEVQGYLLAPPLSPEAMAALMNRGPIAAQTVVHAMAI